MPYVSGQQVVYHSLPVRRSRRCDDGRWTSTYSHRKGKVVLDMVLPNGESKLCTLHEVLYVPKLSYNLLSVAKASKRGKIVKFTKSACYMLDRRHKNGCQGY